MNLLDIIIILIILLGAIRGQHKGLVALIGKLFSFLAAFFLAVFLYQPFADYLNNRFNLIEYISTFLSKHFPLPGDLTGVSTVFIGRGLKDIGEGMAHQGASILINALSFLAILFLVGNLLKFITDKSSAKLNVTFLGGINRLGGFITGAIFSILSLTISLFFVVPLISIMNNSFFTYINNLLKGSILANWMINFVTKILS